MGGINSDHFTFFKILIMQGFMELRKHYDLIIYLIQAMIDSELPCF